jgi:hypothetical protein
VRRPPKSARVEFFRDKDDANQLVGFTLETLPSRRELAKTRFYKGLIVVELALLEGEELPRNELAVVHRALVAATRERPELRYEARSA